MIEIDWNNLKHNSNSKEISFEKFCFQVAVAKFRGYGKFTYPYNMAGSEFYLSLVRPLDYEGTTYPAGSEICWQAKFWVNQNDIENTSLDNRRRKELADGFEITCKAHPDIALWIVCTPGMVKEKAYQDLKTEIAAINPVPHITHWHKSVFESFFIENEDKYKGIAAFFFGKFNLNIDLVTRITSSTIESLKQKFDIELHTETSFEHQLMGMVDTKQAESELKKRLHTLCDRIKHYDERWNNERRKERRAASFSEKVLQTFEEYESYILTLGKELCDTYHEDCLDSMVSKGAFILGGSYEGFENVAKALIDAYAEDKDKMDYNSFEYYSEDIRIIKNIIYSGKELRTGSIEYAIALRKNIYFPVFAQAGYGKTHFACAIANKLLREKQPVLFLTGNRFKSYARPQDVLLKLFEVEGKLTFDELMGALDSLAACYLDARMPIIIDGLNESFPGDAAWKDELPLLQESIKRTEHLFLVTTCREKSEYIQRIYGRTNYEDVDNHIILEGIETVNLAETIRKYFAKYEITNARIINKQPLRNPLLLKIFCEANKESTGLVVNEYSLAECMKDYSNKLVDNIALVDGVLNRTIRHNLKQGLLAMGKLLWERNSRTLDYWNDFNTIFNEKTDQMIEEGICFQVDLNQDDSEVKFTYDLMAGYHIANYLLTCTKDAAELEALLNVPENYVKLFGRGEELHTLSEDIVKSLVYLVANRDHKDLFDLVPKDAALSTILDNLDFICGSENGRESLKKRLEIPLGDELKKDICMLVKERIVNSQSVFGISSLLPAFIQMSTEEMDMLFHSMFLSYGTMEKVAQCVKKHLQENIVIDDALAAGFLFSGTFVREKRHELIRLMTFYAENNFEQYFHVASTTIRINDPYIREAVYLSTVGSAVRCGRQKELELAIKLLTNDMREKPTSHIVLLDLLDTLMEYAKFHHSMAVDKTVLYVSKSDTWPKLQVNWHSSVYEYDFEKFHLRPYSCMPYKSKSPYTSDDLWQMIAKRMTDYGFNDDIYAQKEKNLSDNYRFRQSFVSKMPCKHRDFVQKELVGWLLLNGFIEAKYEGTLRTTEIEIDPSFPRFNPMRNLDTHSYLCREQDDLEKWLSVNPLDLFVKKLYTNLPKSPFKWVLLNGYISQKNEEKENCSSFYWNVKTCLNKNSLNSHEVEDFGSNPSHLYAFEIGWREMKETEGSFSNPEIGMPLLNKYEFTRWDINRDKVTDFYFLNDEICKELGLVFSLKDLSYYRNGEKLVEVYQSVSTSFYYIREDILEELLVKFNVHLDFEMFTSKTNLIRKIGDNSYKDYRQILTYENVKGLYQNT